ncbi:uncharacterized protein E0L32_006689 [Thyridium curvatum]|uniref:Methyltransferase type 12 n=1 Tax=Thyridium curvatum TaxID=1093900 RepID=A0A507B620_9PEZI|nr:uncharacterized protein E0L32_006689 [Thyridium curvatum]TPX12809.1 hypothetical protein E0L32_006689 [Thyridium curvatum]
MAKDSPKADFSHIYNRRDPRQFFKELQSLDYQVPHHALPFLQAAVEWLSRDGDEKPPKVLDICCSYGVNAALLRYEISFAALVDHSSSASRQPAAEEQIASDVRYFSSLPKRYDISIAGLDVAQNAVQYAVGTGLLTAGYTENLEIEEMSPELQQELKEVRLLTCTGGVGYVGVDTFSRIMKAISNPKRVWVVAFVLRIFSYDEISILLSESGLVTEKIPDAVFCQRRFASSEEQQRAMATVRAKGLDPTGLEADGWYYAECFISRPDDEVQRYPLKEVIRIV